MIYRLLLVGKLSGNVVSVTKGMCAPPGYGPEVKEPGTQWPQLSGQFLRVCRIISQEATMVLYSENVFQTAEPYTLYKYFLPAIGVHNVTLLKSVKVDIPPEFIEEPNMYSDIVRRASFTRLAIQDISVLFKKHIGLRSIQEFSLTIPIPDCRHVVCFGYALSTLKIRGLRETHSLQELIGVIGASMMKSKTIKLVKLSPEVRGR